MALTVTPPEEIVVDTRDQHLTRYLRSHKLRQPLADVGLDSEPYVSGSALADQLNIQSENARQMSRGIPLASLSGSKLDAELGALGLNARYPQTGSQGAVVANTSLNGSNIQEGEELTDDNDQIFTVTKTGLYVTGQNIPVQSKTTGPTTNIKAGTKLTWSAPPPGSLPQALVFRQSDGSGLSGGRLSETDDEVRNRISDAKANPPAAGNAAAVIQAIENSRLHGVSVQKGFVMPAVDGPGTYAFCFTMSPASPGSSRIPNATQIQLVRDAVTGLFPADDGPFDCIIIAQPVDIVISVAWGDGAENWVDAVPWPPYYGPATTPRAVVVVGATSATSFIVDCAGGARAGAIAPQPGQTIGVYDPSLGTFHAKRILSIAGAGPWTLTIDTTNGVSDTTYIPAVGQRVCPWSESLDTLIPPVLDYYGSMGPGEQFATFFDPGFRLKRTPFAPRNWPSTITNRLATDVLTLQSVDNAIITEGLNTSTIVGTPGVVSYLIELGFLSAFPV